MRIEIHATQCDGQQFTEVRFIVDNKNCGLGHLPIVAFTSFFGESIAQLLRHEDNLIAQQSFRTRCGADRCRVPGGGIAAVAIFGCVALGVIPPTVGDR
jgi:hypothetical protein